MSKFAFNDLQHRSDSQKGVDRPLRSTHVKFGPIRSNRRPQRALVDFLVNFKFPSQFSCSKFDIDSIRFDSIRFDSIQSVRFDSIRLNPLDLIHLVQPRSVSMANCLFFERSLPLRTFNIWKKKIWLQSHFFDTKPTFWTSSNDLKHVQNPQRRVD